jgi:GR25 family glycosyltransferase involved in LPS biosynthesis
MSELIDLTIGNETLTMYCINLDSAEDRKIHFLQQIEKFSKPIKVIRVPAVNGLTHNFSEKELSMFTNYSTQWFFCREKLTKKIMGNQLSHFYTLLDIVKNNTPYAIVFQDDVILKKDFEMHIDRVLKSVPSDTEIINLGFHKEACGAHFVPFDLNDHTIENAHSKIQLTDGVCVLKEEINPCSLAYIITQKGAKNLVDFFTTNGFEKETDRNFNKYLCSKNIFYASSPILCTGNHHFPSSIFL